MANTTTKKVEQAIDKTKEGAEYVADKAKDAASAVVDGASSLAGSAVKGIDSAAQAVGSGTKSVADTVRRNTPDEGILGAASNKLADGLEAGGKYLEEQGVSGLVGDVSEIIKRNPIGALLVGVGIGYLLARATSRS